MTLVSGDKFYADIRRGSLGRGRQTTVGCRERQSSVFLLAIFPETLEMNPALLCS